MLDPDLQRFAETLGQTRDGMLLRMAMHEGKIAIAQIDRLQRLGRQHARAIASWRRTYIKACEQASQAIDRLWNTHQWPADGARNRLYEWRPPREPHARP